MNAPKLSIKSLPQLVNDWVSKLKRYSLVAFIVLIAVIYGYVVLRINSLRSIEPSPTAVSSQVKAAQIPRVDPTVVKQLESLKDNSVSVKALFDEARSNPFQ